MRMYAHDDAWLVHEFDSLVDFADSLVEYGYVNPENHGRALEHARSGLDQELPQALRILESATEKLLRDQLIEPAFIPVWDVSGAEVDVAAYLAGTPECMIDFTPSGVTGKPVVSIVTCMSLGWVSRQEVMAQGRAVCALVMAIQATGRSVEVWSDNVTGFQRSAGRGSAWRKAHTVKVKVKGANDVLDPARLMFALGSYDMGRTLGDSIFPCLDGRIDRELERQYAVGGAAADDPNPDLYPAGSLILPKPESAFAIIGDDFERYAGSDGLWECTTGKFQRPRCPQRSVLLWITCVS